jgi:hypothetical protein
MSGPFVPLMVIRLELMVEVPPVVSISGDCPLIRIGQEVLVKVPPAIVSGIVEYTPAMFSEPPVMVKEPENMFI